MADHFPPSRPASHPPAPCLCDRCAHARKLDAAGRTAYLLCGRSATDPTFPRHPVLPLEFCPGFEARPVP